ncbi:hypothetical protein RRG08_054077 [Elysia crispata]|uniref:Uncharacterized protein n=1 Tax=Elysia crispata TaxID=231223 RepID=A0AAE0ZCR1_9GAST|nr:hypothetical protein RRG08_054077 [Elysia crispata]
MSKGDQFFATSLATSGPSQALGHITEGEYLCETVEKDSQQSARRAPLFDLFSSFYGLKIEINIRQLIIAKLTMRKIFE